MSESHFNLLTSTKSVLSNLLASDRFPLSQDIRQLAKDVVFEVPKPAKDSADIEVALPCPLKQTECISSLKAIEGTIANAIGKLRYGYEQQVTVDIMHATVFLFMAYLSSVDGKGKTNPAVKELLKDSDLHNVYSDLYRRLASNLYKTKDNKYFHIHGSLDSTPTLNMLGLPGFDPTLTDYQQIIDTIGKAVAKFTAEELQQMTDENNQAGTTALKRSEFDASEHGKFLNTHPYWDFEVLEDSTPAVPFPPLAPGAKPQVLAGVKVVEMCRIIAGPSISRILAEYGAEVIKITSPNLSDTPYYQVDGNFGKHTAELDLKGSAEDCKTFEQLLESADVIVDGYRAGALNRLGYGTEYFKQKGVARGKGYVYVSENCYGLKGEWSYRRGWQQIGDAVSGVAWIQGTAFGADAPMIPPFPMSDYGTGSMGAIAALNALYLRATKGGSYWTFTSIAQYDLLLMDQGLYPDDVWKRTLDAQDEELKKMEYYQSMDVVSSAGLKSFKRLRPELFSEEGTEKYLVSMLSPGFHNKIVTTVKPVVQLERTPLWFEEPTRPNGFDKPEWWK